MYLDAVKAEENKDLEKALALYEKLGTFAEAHQEAERIRKAIPEAAVKEGRALMAKGEYEAARELFLSLDGYGASKTLADNCTAALNKAAYNAAEELFKAGDLLGAMDAFNALGDSLEGAKRAQDILHVIHQELDARYAAVTLTTASALIQDYRMLGEDDIASQRIAELTARFGKNLELIAMDAPVIQLGSYPYTENGEEHAVLWRVLKTDGSIVTLLSEAVLDASADAQPIQLTLNDKERSAVLEMTLPSMADLAARSDLTCLATPYAQVQGAVNENGATAYWLRDSLENGQHPVIGASGSLTLPEAGVIPGICPIMTLDLEKITFTAGSGVKADPFRAE